MDEFLAIVRELAERMRPEVERVRKGDLDVNDLVKLDEASGLRILPRWLAQPYFRPLPEAKKITAKGATEVATPKVVAPTSELIVPAESRREKEEGGKEEMAGVAKTPNEDVLAENVPVVTV